MRIKNILLLFIGLLIISISFTVKADGYSYYLSRSDLNNEYVEKDNIKTVNINRGDYINVVSVIDGFDTSYRLDKGKLTVRWDSEYVDLVETGGKYFSSSLSYGSINKISSKITIDGFSSSNLIYLGKYVLFELRFQVLKTAKAGAFKIYQMDDEDTITCVDNDNDSFVCAGSYYTELKYNVLKSTNNKLSGIKLDGHELEDFNENSLEYDIEVDKDVDKITIEATKKDDYAVVGGDLGTKSLTYGINTFKINVISEAGETKTYTLKITRIDERSKVNTLKTLTISGVDFAFKPNVLEYNIDVNNEVDKVTISSTLTDPRALYVNGFGDREETLNEGNNKILIKVLSENEEEKVYTLNITRALSGNNTLKSLTVNDEKITLEDNIFTYHYEVETEVDEVVIVAKPTEAKAVVNVKDIYELDVGENEINIDITAPDGARASYLLIINRKKILSDNSRLSNIKVIGYKMRFDPDIRLYNLRVKDEVEKLDIYTVPEDTLATVEIEGNENLVHGSIIKINVKAEDGTYGRYFINIEKSTKNNLLPIIITIIVLLILTIICLIIIIKRKRKDKDKIKDIQEKILEESKETEPLDDDINIEADDYEVDEETPREEENKDTV